MTGSTDGIREVVARYAFALDSRDHAALAALHTADADWSFIVASEEVGHVRGRDAILAFASAPAAGQPVQQRHVLTNLVVEPGTSAATKQVVGYLALYTTPGSDGETSPRLTALGTATFTLTAVEESWLISGLRIAFDSPPAAH